MEGKSKFDHAAAQIIAGLGGIENLKTLDYCATRLRIEVENDDSVDDAQIKAAEIAGLMRPAKGSVRVVIGPDVQFIACAFENKNEIITK